MKPSYTILRFVVAFLVITYGCAKLNGSQFTILDSELDKPMGQVSGFWLTWYFFGYSPFYGNIIALAQVLGGFLLTFRRTTLIAIFLLLPIITNIILVDIFYAIDIGALLVALFIEIALLIILSPYAPELYDLFWGRREVPASSDTSIRIKVGKYTARALVILIPVVLTYWVANYNNRYPTPIDGAWEVMEVSPGPPSQASAPSSVFFERNRAHLAVFKHGDGSYQWHHFEVDPGTQTIAIWQDWLRKGTKIFEGHYGPSGGQLQLKGRFTNEAEELVMTLRRRS